MNLEGSRALQELPEEIGSLESLTELTLPLDSDVSKVPETGGNLKSLSSLKDRKCKNQRALMLYWWTEAYAFVSERMLSDKGTSMLTRGIRSIGGVAFVIIRDGKSVWFNWESKKTESE